jgi:uncharacterized protein YkwD
MRLSDFKFKSRPKRLSRQLPWVGAVMLMGLLSGCQELRAALREAKERAADLPTIESPDPSVPVQSETAAEIESGIHRQINQVRQQDGLEQLAYNERLAVVARRYSQQMAEQNFFSHTSPEGSTPADRVQADRITYTVVGENLFKGTNVSRPVSTAVKGWLESPGHRENILRSAFAETGIGVWKQGNTYYITQLFMRS